MPLTLSIENVPDDIIRIIKLKAARHHRSLQGELLTMLEEAARAETSRLLTIKEIAALAETVDFSLPNETTRMLREDRDR